MSSSLTAPPSQATKLELTLIQGDLSKLSPEERVSYYNRTCESLGLNPLTKPFDYLSLNNKLTLYAKRDATDQLRKIHNVSVKIVSRENIDGVFVVTAQATLPSGRVDESIGAVQVNGLKGDVLANALMKCETKAKRRVTLSICGLGLLDETEVETIPDAKLKDFAAVAPGPGYSENPHEENDGQEIDDFDLGEYVIPIGKKYVGKKLSEVAPDLLVSWVRTLENLSHEEQRPIRGRTLEAISKVYAYFKEQGYTGLDDA